MTRNFIKLVTMVTSTIVILALFWLWIDNQLDLGVGIVLGAAWGCVNLYFIMHLVENLLSLQTKSARNICFLLGFKFPMLYTLGYVMLRLDNISAHALMYGFSLFLAVVICIGAMMVFLYKPQRGVNHGK